MIILGLFPPNSGDLRKEIKKGLTFLLFSRLFLFFLSLVVQLPSLVLNIFNFRGGVPKLLGLGSFKSLSRSLLLGILMGAIGVCFSGEVCTVFTGDLDLNLERWESSGRSKMEEKELFVFLAFSLLPGRRLSSGTEVAFSKSSVEGTLVSGGDRTERIFSNSGAAKPSSVSERSDMSSKPPKSILGSVFFAPAGGAAAGVAAEEDDVVSKLREGMGGSLPSRVLVTVVGLKWGVARLLDLGGGAALGAGAGFSLSTTTGVSFLSFTVSKRESNS